MSGPNRMLSFEDTILSYKSEFPRRFFFQIAFLHKKNSGGHYCDFLRFVDECHNLDFYILMDLADLARIRLLWLRARAYPKAIFFVREDERKSMTVSGQRVVLVLRFFPMCFCSNSK